MSIFRWYTLIIHTYSICIYIYKYITPTYINLYKTTSVTVSVHINMRLYYVLNIYIYLSLHVPATQPQHPLPRQHHALRQSHATPSRSVQALSKRPGETVAEPTFTRGKWSFFRIWHGKMLEHSDLMSFQKNMDSEHWVIGITIMFWLEYPRTMVT